MMHQVADVYGPLNLNEIGAKSQQDLWFNYSTVTRQFRDKVVEVYQQEDLVWIHGFHLMLLPSFLRRILLHAKIGIFFHTPFPSSEIWRTMTRREDLIRGILSADHIGFHLYEYARHFRSVCHRLLGYNSEMSPSGTLTVYVDGREVAITCMHVGVDLPRLQLALTSETFENEVRFWSSKFPNRIIVAG
jgi:trehalose 6-phosphate synthase/phosphatase